MGECRYEIRIRGRLSSRLLATFSTLAGEVRPAVTVLRGSDLDQAALHGLLERIRALDLDLLEVRELSGRPR